MTPYSANPFAFIFPAILLAAVLCYFTFAAVDRVGLSLVKTAGQVVEKHFNKSGTSYYTSIIDGRSIVQSQETPETYVLVLTVNSERTASLVSKMLYESLQPKDTVWLQVRRRRLTGKLEVVSVAQ